MKSHTVKQKITLSPIGTFSVLLFQQAKTKIENIFGYEVEITPTLTDITFAFDRNREQYNSTLILEKLSEIIPADNAKIAAITHVDLFIPILTYVYGEAQLGGKSCIISIHRLKDDLSPIGYEMNLSNRISKEIIHELGHTFNLHHCKDPLCIMHYCRNIKDVDRKSDRLCRYCRILLDDEKKNIVKQDNIKG